MDTNIAEDILLVFAVVTAPGDTKSLTPAVSATHLFTEEFLIQCLGIEEMSKKHPPEDVWNMPIPTASKKLIQGDKRAWSALIAIALEHLGEYRMADFQRIVAASPFRGMVAVPFKESPLEGRMFAYKTEHLDIILTRMMEKQCQTAWPETGILFISQDDVHPIVHVAVGSE